MWDKGEKKNRNTKNNKRRGRQKETKVKRTVCNETTMAQKKSDQRETELPAHHPQIPTETIAERPKSFNPTDRRDSGTLLRVSDHGRP